MKSEHRGYEITFIEDGETWSCGSLALTDQSLKALKRKIDKAHKERRSVNVPALYLKERHWNEIPTLCDVVVTLLRDGDRKCNVKDGRDILEIDISDVYPQDEHVKLQNYIHLKKLQARAEKATQKAQDKLKPFTAEKIREIVAVKAEEET